MTTHPDDKPYERVVTLLLALLLVGIFATVCLVQRGCSDAQVLLPTDHVLPIVPIVPRAAPPLATAPTVPTPESGSLPAKAKPARTSRG